MWTDHLLHHLIRESPRSAPPERLQTRVPKGWEQDVRIFERGRHGRLLSEGIGRIALLYLYVTGMAATAGICTSAV